MLGLLALGASFRLAGDDGGATTDPYAPPRADAEHREARADVVIEYGIDSSERRFYRPRFRLDWPLGRHDMFAELRYDERINGRLQGAIDYWVMVGTTRQLASWLQLEARLNHFCRHHTGLDTAYVLNLNEVLARVWLQGRRLRLGLGGGVYTGGSDAYRRLLTASLELPRFALPELSLAAEVKWVDLRRFLFEAEAALQLGRGVALFLRHTRTYQFPTMTYLGLRLSAAGGFRPLADRLRLFSGIYINDALYKLFVRGDYRLMFLQRDDRRFYLTAAFVTPVLSGDRFFSQFWPDKMVYDVSGEYERRLRPGLYVSWYARYAVDMPVDKELPFRSSLATGLAVRNQPDFERLDRRLRLEAGAGVDFRHHYDFSLKLGLNSRPGRAVVFAADATGQFNAERLVLEATAFVDWGRRVHARPFLRWTRTAWRGDRLPADHRLAVGFGWCRWF